ncbi:MAG TPA: glycosyltransferase [Vicinamibacteria bacterium]|nr:glycosyltransferase [Vicinamibacteria bacterium]
MRIVHADSARNWRGGQNQVLLTSSGMAARGHEIWLACQDGGPLEARARAAGLAVRPMAFHGDFSPGAVVGLARLVREAQPDVVHLHDPHAVSAGLAASTLAPGFRHIASRRVDFPLRGPLSRWKYGACRRVIAVSRAIASQLEADGVPRERIRLVYEGVPDRAAVANGRRALQELGVPLEAPVVGNVAALTGHKDHVTLLEAAAAVKRRLSEARFVIVGDGELRGALEERSRALSLQDRVVFAGFRDDLDRLMPAFTVFCLSSHLEGLGTSLLDAMAFARPVVATAAGGIPEAVEDGVTGRVVPPRDPRALAAALVEVLEDPARRRAMGAAGRARFEERFTADRMVEQTLAVYAEREP